MPKFEPGQSGNPEGRPKGSSNLVPLKKLLESNGEKLVNKLIELALNGDQQALKLCVSRLIPPLPPSLPEITKPYRCESKSDESDEIYQLMINGQITPNQGTELLRAIQTSCHIEEHETLKKRVIALEDAIRGRKNAITQD